MRVERVVGFWLVWWRESFGDWCRRELFDYGLYDIRYDYWFEELAGIAAAEACRRLIRVIWKR